MDSFSPSELDWERISDILKGKIHLGPKFVTVDITSVCNLNCIFCRSHSRFIKLFPLCEVRLDKALEAISSLVPLGLEEVNVSGDGEPTLHPQFSWFIQELVKLKLRVNVFTNLTFKDESLLPVLASVESVVVNLSSFFNYKSIHGKDFANQVLRNLVDLMTLMKSKENLHNGVDISFVLSRPNARYALEISSLAKKLHIWIEFAIGGGEELPNKLFFRFRDEFKPILEQVNVFYPNGTNADWFIEEETSPLSFSRCFIGWFHCFIDVFGRMHFCCQHPDTQFGEWEGDIVETWFLPQTHEKRKVLTFLNPMNCKYCRYCAEALLLKWVDDVVTKGGMDDLFHLGN